MINSEDLLKEKMIPERALIVYKQGNENSYYIEDRKILKTKRGYEMIDGSPLTKETLAAIIKTIKVDESKQRFYSKGLFPENLIYFNDDFNDETVIWKVESRWVFLSFSESLGIKDRQILIPKLIFKVRNNSLEVYAIKKSGDDAILYRAPFHNISSTNNVCMGSAKVKRSKELKTFMKEYEKGFFSSKFTHLQSNGSPIIGNLNTYLAENNKIENKVLLKTNMKLKDLI